MTTKSTSKLHTSESNPTVTELEGQITDLNKEIVDLREKVFSLRNEVHSLRSSRVIGRIIKTRDKLGNPYTLPFRVVHMTRRTIAPFIPDSIRLPLMKSLRRSRDGLREKRRSIKERNITIRAIKNTSWEPDASLVSVVIPYYNRVDTIDDTLQSLDIQTFRDFEVIIVDDNSSDKESIEKLKTIKNAKIIHHKINKGVATARNNGIREARGKYIICLDSDDILEPTYIEKATVTLETNPDISLVTTYQDMFGVVSELMEKHPYDPLRLLLDNMVTTAAEFRKEAWENSDGYKSGIGYEDWDFWLTLAERGYWGKLIPEPLFKYRTSMQSRYIEDKDVHWSNIKIIRSLHPKYKSNVKSILLSRQKTRTVIDKPTAFINFRDKSMYQQQENNKPNILITVPWMDFGGVSTLLNNFTREVADDVNLHFITGLTNKNEWDYKFKEITPLVYHMPNMFDEDPELQLEFISNYIATRSIDILHILHNGFIYPMLDELKRRHPTLKVVSTVFNNRAPYLDQSIAHKEHIDVFSTDNLAVGKIYNDTFGSDEKIRIIPNGINTDTVFNPLLFDRDRVRADLQITHDEVAVFYIGRLSEEKNPDLYVEAVNIMLGRNVKNAKYFMVGDGPMRDEVQKAVFDIKSRPISYLGYQANIAEFLAAADVFVLPSAVEGFPLSILEAMAMNVAVIATNVGAVSDVVVQGRNGIIIDNISAQSIADSLEKIIDDPKLLEQIKMRTRRDVEQKYSSTVLGNNYRKLYKDLKT